MAIEVRHSADDKAAFTAAPFARILADAGIFVPVAFAYFATAMASVALLAPPDRVVSIWPAAGIAVGVLLMLGARACWPVAAAVASANLAAGAYLEKPLITASALALVNVFECLLVAWLTERLAGTPLNLNRLSRVIAFLTAALVGTAIAAVPAAVAITFGAHGPVALFDVWSLWFRSDFIGIVTVAPVFVGLGLAIREPPTRLEIAEGLLLLLLLGAAAVYLLTLPPQGGPWPASVASSLLFPFMLAVAARCRLLFPAAGSFMIAAVIIVTANLGIGRFGAGDFTIESRIIAAQTAMAVIALCSLSLAALFARGHEAEDALRKSEEQLRVSLAAGQLGHWVYDLTRREVTGSDLSYAVFGGMPRPCMGYDEVVSAVHRDDRARFEAAVATAVQHTDEFDIECRAFWPDRTVHWVHMVGRVSRDRAGRPVKLHGTSRDITRRKLAESALVESEQSQRLALDAANLGTWRHDVAASKVTFDERAMQHVGAGPSLDWNRFLELLHADDGDAAAHVFQAALEPSSSAAQSVGEFHVRMPGGSWRWIRVDAVVAFEGAGASRRPVAMVGTTQDVTERKRSEELQTLLVRELDHRVKNMLTVISVLIERSAETAASPETVVDGIRARVGAMGRVHDRLSLSKWSGVDLKTIIEDELAAYRTPSNVQLDGPSLMLSAEAAMTLSMTVHELATNAAKHGSLSVAEGRVRVDWDIVPDQLEQSMLVLRWQEAGGPPVPSSPRRVGYGNGIIRGLVRTELSGCVDFALEPAGARCELRIPATKALADAGAALPPVLNR